MDGVCELNKQKVRLFIGAVLNEGRLEMIEELLAADYVGHFPGVPVVGRDAMRALVSSRRQEYPGLFVEVEDQVAEEDRVVTRWLLDVPKQDLYRQQELPLRNLDCAAAGRQAGRFVHPADVPGDRQIFG